MNYVLNSQTITSTNSPTTVMPREIPDNLGSSALVGLGGVALGVWQEVRHTPLESMPVTRKAL